MEGTTPIRASAPRRVESGRWLGEGAEPRGRGRVLVISNDRPSQSVIATLATIEGCEAMVSRHGDDAVQAVSTWGARLIVVDLDDIESEQSVVLELYRQSSRPDVPIVLLSGSDLSDGFLNQEGVVAVLAKPFPAAELMDLLRKFAHCSG